MTGMTTRIIQTTTMLTLAAGLLAGCESLPDHTFMSMDRHVYHSTVQLPTNVQIVEPYSGEVLWSMEVPVEHKLVLDFDRKGEAELVSVSQHPATNMKWWLVPQGKGQKESGSVALNGTPVSMKVSYRKSPEFPADKTPAAFEVRGEPIKPEPAAPAADEPAADAPAADEPAPVNGDAPASEEPAAAADDAAPAASDTTMESNEPADAAMTK